MCTEPCLLSSAPVPGPCSERLCETPCFATFSSATDRTLRTTETLEGASER